MKYAHLVKQKSIHSKIARVLLALALLLPTTLTGLTASPSTAHAATPQVKYYNQDGRSFGEVIGLSRNDYISYLKSHLNDNYYLGTPYKGGDHRNPNGDCAGAYGVLDQAGQAAMNCTGFVWHTLYKASHKSYEDADRNIPSMGQGKSWSAFLRNNHISYITVTGDQWFPDVCFKLKELINNGTIKQGDIIWTWDTPVGSDGLPVRPADDHHVSIFMGDDQDIYKTYSPYKISSRAFMGAWHSESADDVPFEIITDNPLKSRWTKVHENVISDLRPKNYATRPFSVTIVPLDGQGALDLQKVSANPAISNNNKCYSLEGAIYGIFSDKACTHKIAEMTTDIQGYAKSVSLSRGMYYVKEIRPPHGYALDVSIYPAWVQSNETRRVNAAPVKDVPQNDPISAFIEKRDSVTGKGIPQANGELEGAEFTVKYYDGFYNEQNLPAQATRTWVLRTNDKGRARLFDSYKVAGDEIYTTGNGSPTIPLGTISIQETKAPKGYLLPADNRPSVQQVTANGWLESVNTLNTRIQPETPIRGGVKIEKQDDTTGNTPQGNANFAGISFVIINKSKNPVTINGKTANTGEVALTLTTDNTGRASTSSETLPYGTYEIRESKTNAGYLNTSRPQEFTISENKQVVTYDGVHAFTDAVVRGTLDLEKQDSVTGATPQGNAHFDGIEFEVINRSLNPVFVDGKIYKTGEVVAKLKTKDAHASLPDKYLPFGTYEVKETVSNDGYLKTAASKTVEITKDGERVSLTSSNSFMNLVKRGGFELEKQDDTTGATPQGNASFAGIEFSVINKSKNPVYVQGKLYKVGEVCWKGKTNSEGKIKLDDDLLPYGAYILRETATNDSYLNTSQEIEFTVTQDKEYFKFASTKSFTDAVVRGGIRIEKQDDRTTDTPQGDGSFNEIEFSIINRSQNPVCVDGKTYKTGEVVKTLYTKDGRAETADDALPYGTYEVKETATNSSYLNTSTPQTVEIRENKKMYALTADRSFKDAVVRGGFELEKRDSVTADTPQGNANFEGIEFELVNKSEHPVLVDNKLYEPEKTVWTGKTDAHGRVSVSPDYLPYGTYLLQETATNAGYLNTSRPVTFSVRTDKEVISFTEDKSFTDDVVRGGVAIEKRDAETKDHRTLGNAKLNPTTFEVINKSKNPVVVDGKAYKTGEVVLTLVTDEEGKAQSDKLALSFGDYEIKEVATTDGYNLTDPMPRSFTISENEQVVEFTGDHAFYNQVKRADLEFIKVAAADNKRIAHVPFKLTSETTGETHILVTDANGYVSTAANWNAHTHNTNGNDHLIDTPEYADVEGVVDTKAGVWFGKASDGSTVDPDDTLGALPYDTYTLEELQVKGNKHYEMVKIEHIAVDRDRVSVNLGTITDNSKPPVSIKTHALNPDTNAQTLYLHDKATIKDSVEYKNLIVGRTYTLKGSLHDPESGDAILIDGKPVEGTTTFTPDTPDGTVEVEFTLNARDMKGKSLVLFEELYDWDRELVATHADKTDKGQTVRVASPEITSLATDTADGDKELEAVGTVTITDKVMYKDLEPNREHTLKGVLMDKATGEPFLIDGKPVESEIVFTPHGTEGEALVTFSFDAAHAQGKELVVFEKLYDADGKLISEHTDINDGAQTVKVKTPETPSMPVTGDYTLAGFICMLGVGFISLLVLSVWWRDERRLRKQRKDHDNKRS